MEAVANVVKSDTSGIDAKFYYISPQDKKQIQDYMARFG
jgi:hypothetical protein